MATAMTLVGLDVHATQTHAAVLVCESGELRCCRLRVAPEEVVLFLAAQGQTVARHQEGQDPRVIEIAWRANDACTNAGSTLHSERRKRSGVVAIAVARELAAFLWEAATLNA